jgi:hypothetical protein
VSSDSEKRKRNIALRGFAAYLSSSTLSLLHHSYFRYVAALESRILGLDAEESGGEGSETVGVAKHFNNLVQLISIAHKLVGGTDSVQAKSAEDIASGISGVQSCVRIFTLWLSSGDFHNSKTAVGKRKAGSSTATLMALQTLETLLQQQYKRLWTLLFDLLQSDVEAVQSNALHAAMDLVQAEGAAALGAAPSSKSPSTTALESLSSGSFSQLLRGVFLSPSVAASTRAEFLTEQFVLKHADLRLAALRELRQLVQLSPEQLRDEAAAWNSAVGPKKGTPEAEGITNIVNFLLEADHSTPLEQNWIVSAPSAAEGEDEDMFGLPASLSSGSNATFSPESTKKLYGEVWLGVLRHRLPNIELYKRILADLHSVVLPTLASPLLLADFLTDSYDQGGLISLLALNALFILISKYNLDYPQFYAKLYRICKPSIFHARYRARFFQLVALFLTSSFLPSYLVCAFTKRFARLSLTAPPSGAIFCVAVVYNLLRRHPVARGLINRELKRGQEEKIEAAFRMGEQDAAAGATSAPASAGAATSAPKKSVNAGVLNSLSSLLSARSKAAAAGTLVNPADIDPDDPASSSLLLNLPVYNPPPPEQSMTLGTDPYLFEADDPAASNAAASSLWEIDSLTRHFSPTVANLAKVFFTSHAPKKDLELEKYIQQSYETVSGKSNRVDSGFVPFHAFFFFFFIFHFAHFSP